MPAPLSDILSRIYAVKKEIIPVKMKLYGDDTKARREFETKPAISDRVYGIGYSIWNSTSDIPQTFKDSYNIAEKQYNEIYPVIKDLHTKTEKIEAELNRNKAPYTPGRWPDKR